MLTALGRPGRRPAVLPADDHGGPRRCESSTADTRSLDQQLGSEFVANDVTFGEADSLQLITGPNMAGKSTFIRQVALITLLAQVGSYVPAKSATIGLADRLFTRIGASDELHGGQSTFMVEMTETANILNNATDRSLVVLDEIGRGTSTLDGLSLAWAIAEHIAGTVACRTLFATHYHELTDLSDRYTGVKNLNVLRSRVGGPRSSSCTGSLRAAPTAATASTSPGLAGVPKDVLDRARQLLGELAVQHVGRPKVSRRGNRAAFEKDAEPDAAVRRPVGRADAVAGRRGRGRPDADGGVRPAAGVEAEVRTTIRLE